MENHTGYPNALRLALGHGISKTYTLTYDDGSPVVFESIVATLTTQRRVPTEVQWTTSSPAPGVAAFSLSNADLTALGIGAYLYSFSVLVGGVLQPLLGSSLEVVPPSSGKTSQSSSGTITVASSTSNGLITVLGTSRPSGLTGGIDGDGNPYYEIPFSYYGIDDDGNPYYDLAGVIDGDEAWLTLNLDGDPVLVSL